MHAFTSLAGYFPPGWHSCLAKKAAEEAARKAAEEAARKAAEEKAAAKEEAKVKLAKAAAQVVAADPQKAADMFKCMSGCVMGFPWKPEGAGWVCEGGSHHVTNEELMAEVNKTANLKPKSLEP